MNIHNTKSHEISTKSLGQQALVQIRGYLPEIQQRASQLDRYPAFPSKDVSLLRDLGVLEIFGSDAVTASELFEAFRLVGRANLSLGRIFEGHVNGARLVAWYGDNEQNRQLAADLRDGKLFGVWNTEPPPGVALVNGDAAAGRLQGAKSYATGAGFVDRAVITAKGAGGRQMLIVDGRQADRADLATWNVRGMRATCSGAYDLSDMIVTEAMLLGQPDDYLREPRFSAGAWRFTAVQLGGVERILTLVRDHLAQSGGELDPINAARFGKALADTRSAYLWVREAARRVESASCGADEIAFVLLTRGVVERAGFEVMEMAARAVGTRAFFTDNPLDQACRDLGLYLRQPVPDQALDRAARAFLARDCWADDRLW